MPSYGQRTERQDFGGTAPNQGSVSVSQALAYAKDALSQVTLTIKGEISELSDKPGYKAVYFTLSDKSSALPCLIWKNVYEYCDVRLRLGMLVEVTGTFSVYAAKGRMNFTAKSIRLAGSGDIREQVAQLARKLQAEGLMDPARKRELPITPTSIAVVTSPRGKAVHDCLRTLRRRWPFAEVYVCGVTVEGARAPQELIYGLQVAQESGAQVILLVRGGGSYEDLMPFNDEGLARAVASCPVPVVTGIGHEPDTTICDMVSDRRCSTPTAAAEAVTPAREEILMRLDDTANRLSLGLEKTVEAYKARLNRYEASPVFHNPRIAVAPRHEMLKRLHIRLSSALPNAMAKDRLHIDNLTARMVAAGKRIPEKPAEQIALRAARLSDLSPLSVLTRGYAIVEDAVDGRVIESVKSAEMDNAIDIRLKDGTLHGIVTGIEEEDLHG